MPPRISLALAIHNHQPVGNFGWVFGEVHDAAYLPMLEALERHPSVRLSLHYTGPLLEWLRAERPGFIERLRALVERGQVELLGGGYYEPVLASLPERDRIGQLTRMADELERTTGTRPRGAWLAERVWEPDLPTALVTAGYRWTILDDAHFRAASIPEERLWGAHTTDDQGRLLTVFGTEQGLRYLIPFGEVDDLIAHLRAHASEEGDRVGVMGDDGEKFGAWPTTWEHCWGGGRWVERFFSALESNADWLTTVTPSAWLERHPPIGRVYIPTSSYAEMGEWALPAAESLAYARFSHEALAQGRPEAAWLRGGYWRNFQVKYREINDLHKQMLRASEAVAAMPDGPARAQALDHLYQGQSNDCYWHGLFGGIYISHMRLATYEHLIAAEDAATTAARATGRRADGGRLVDTDLDGIDEVLFPAPGQVVTVKPSEGAGIGGWDIRAVRHALTAVMRRRPEAYHATLLARAADAERRAEAERAADAAAAAGAAAASSGGGVTSIHEIVTLKEPGLASHLFYDDHERRSGLVRILGPAASPEALRQGRPDELGDFATGPFVVDELTDERLVCHRDAAVRRDDSQHRDGAAADDAEAGGLRVVKVLTLGGDRRAPTLGLRVTVENRATARVEARLGLEWNLTMLGGGGNPAAWHDPGDGRIPHDGTGAAGDVALARSGNDWIGLELEARIAPPAEAWWYPIETISNSESGFERVYQGSCMTYVWPLDLGPGERLVVELDHRVTTTRDRTAEEAATGAGDTGRVVPAGERGPDAEAGVRTAAG